MDLYIRLSRAYLVKTSSAVHMHNFCPIIDRTSTLIRKKIKKIYKTIDHEK